MRYGMGADDYEKFLINAHKSGKFNPKTLFLINKIPVDSYLGNIGIKTKITNISFGIKAAFGSADVREELFPAHKDNPHGLIFFPNS